MFDKTVSGIANLRIKKTIYPLILSVFSAIALVVFFVATRFLYQNINKAFVMDEALLESKLVKIDFNQFDAVADRLQLSEDSEDILRQEDERTSDADNNEKADEDKQKEIDISEIRINVLNVAAVPGSAGKVKELLVGKGYEATEAGNGEKNNLTESRVTYGETKFQEEAEKIKTLLKEMEISAEVSLAESEEEKSGDVVILLGK